MSIIDALDNSEPVITPERFYKKIEKKTDICIVTFSYHVIEKILETYEHEEVGYAATCNGHILVYYLNELNVLTYMSPISAPVSSVILEEVACFTQATNFIFFGSCGVLDKKYQNSLIIPTKSYRDEGFSYHYVEPSDFIDIKNANKLKDIFNQYNIQYEQGYAWTTDACYKETINKCNKRKEEGCICVEMESSALQAISNYLNINLYIFFFAGDILDSGWEPGNLIGENHRNKQLGTFDIVLIVAKNIK